MKEKICYYCETKYSADEPRCPLCGQTETMEDAIDEMPVDLKPSADDREKTQRQDTAVKRNRRKKSNVLATLLCIILAVAVVGCTLWILNSIGILSFKPAPADETSLDLPVDEEPEAGVTEISVDPDRMAFSAAGQKSVLMISFASESGIQPDLNVPVLFKSADPTVASVSSEGEVTAVGTGETLITATYGDLSAVCSVSCEFEESSDVPPVTDTQPSPEEEDHDTEQDEPFKLSLEDFTLFSAGEKAAIKALNVPENAEVVWSSKNESVASVSDGVVTAIGPGVTTVSATYDGTTLNCIVRCRIEAGTEPIVTATDDGVALSQDDVTLMEPGESFTLRLLNGETAVSGVSWSTTDASVCTVSPDGRVSAVGAGTAKIIGTYHGSSYSCIVRCRF